jgi:hypothetical protein
MDFADDPRTLSVSTHQWALTCNLKDDVHFKALFIANSLYNLHKGQVLVND